MLDEHFYIIYILFEYNATDDNKTRFLQYEDGSYVKVIFLKNIHKSVRVNPKPQLQVNYKMPDEYRSKENFVDMFEQKYTESLDRIVINVDKTRKNIKKEFEQIRKKHFK
jgi:hypothetical protein